MEIEQHHVETAYRKLKRDVYYNKNDLHLRHRLAKFECSKNFEKRLATIKRVLNNKAPMYNPTLKGWIDDIGFRIVPKSLSSQEATSVDSSEIQGRYISNVTSAKHLQVERVNYFFDGPIEIHLIAVLWIMFEGHYLDAMLGKECFGSRLSGVVGDEDDESAELFRKYHTLYAQWRDSGIKKAKQLLTEDKTSVCILGLDVQEYYYRIKLDFSDLANAINEARNEKEQDDSFKDKPSNLLQLLEAICINYRHKIDSSIKQTHSEQPSLDTGIPIGLCSSALLANWYLRPFDKAVKARIRPAYYGRYIDDILLVVETSDDPSKNGHPVVDFIDDVLVRNDVLRRPIDDRYEINNPRGLNLQKAKCILQFFDVKHSIAGLEKFQKKLEENSSDFLLLPVDEADSSLEDVAYELMYEGSVNKFRSVKGLAENRYELAKNLARQTMLHLLTDDRPSPEISLGLRRFFRGRNAILFHDLWERVFTYFVIGNDVRSAGIFERSLRAEINRLRLKGKGGISKDLKSNLEFHLTLSRAMGDSLSIDDDSLFEAFEEGSSLTFRRANLLRHHYVRYPLLNYTDYSGPLTTWRPNQSIKVNDEKLKWSPRYVNFDECLLLVESAEPAVEKLNPIDKASEIFELANGQSITGVQWKQVHSGLGNSYD